MRRVERKNKKNRFKVSQHEQVHFRRHKQTEVMVTRRLDDVMDLQSYSVSEILTLFFKI